MWRMLCGSKKGKDFTVTFSDIAVNENTRKVHWDAIIILVKQVEGSIIRLQQNLNLKMALSLSIQIHLIFTNGLRKH